MLTTITLVVKVIAVNLNNLLKRPERIAMTATLTAHGAMAHVPMTDDPSLGRVAAALLALGALGIVATSACYAMAGPVAALPGSGGPSYSALQLATAQGAGWMRAASLFGLPSDILATVGAAMMATTRRGRGAALAGAGWLAIALASLLFVSVDAMVGLVLPTVSAMPDSAAAYTGLRALFEALFGIGTWAVGFGLVAATWHTHWPEFKSRTLLWFSRVAGVLSMVSAWAFFYAWPLQRLMGIAVALSAVALVVIGVVAWRRRD